MNNNKTVYKTSYSAIYMIVMCILKLFNVINVSWFWVFLPFLVGLGLIIIGFLMLGIAEYFNK